MFERFRAKRSVPEATGEIPGADPLREFADWAAQRAEGLCWVRRTGGLDDLFAAVVQDLPELGRSSLRWSGAGVLHDSAAEWFAFEGADAAVLVFAMSRAKHVGFRQVGVMTALSRHDAHVVAGGAVPKRLQRDLHDLRGVPVWDIAGLGRLRPTAPQEAAVRQAA